MGLTLGDFADRHAGQDVYVLGSGPSLNHLDPAFFAGKVTVSTNHGSLLILDRVDYLVTKYHRHAWEYADQWPNIPVVTTRHDTGVFSGGRLGDETPFLVVEHNDNTCDKWTPDQWPTAGLVATWSSITTAMHFAAHLGAANILMVGHDLGHIGGAGRIPGYRQRADGVADDDGDQHMWATFDRQSQQVKRELLARYEGLRNVVSVLPFINANMEGHHWSSFAGRLND